jgi:hypothetical protein
MPDDVKHLKELLACYGSDMDHWPHHEKAFGTRALKQPGLAALIDAERRFELVLQKRNLPGPGDLARRIVDASHHLPQKTNNFMSEILADVRPAAWAAMLVLGFAVGFGMTATPAHVQGSVIVQSVADDEGAVL